MKLADHISKTVLSYYRVADIAIPNYYFNWFECDVLRITKSGYSYEYEIKISRSDFFNDVKKESFGRHKHTGIKDGSRTNFFFFVVPEGLIKSDECPDYAGLIYFKNGRLEIIKMAKRLHKDKFNKSGLVSSLHAREMHIRDKFMRLKRDTSHISELHKQIKSLESRNNALLVRNSILEAEPEDARMVERLKLNKDYQKFYPEKCN
jgi:hypothetical protein